MRYRFPRINYLVSTLTKTSESFRVQMNCSVVGWHAQIWQWLLRLIHDVLARFDFIGAYSWRRGTVPFLSLGRRWRSTWHACSKRKFCVGWELLDYGLKCREITCKVSYSRSMRGLRPRLLIRYWPKLSVSSLYDLALFVFYKTITMAKCQTLLHCNACVTFLQV
jgi:hypothetical protein